ncbi:glycosyltransferase family 4 protein [Actinokineospora guangxiensis]|uniref:Glycosyltransferase family 4 protein n=1 Tax=Actinokineospora guangxiensis TaxID=1490288 RepID=A0ABW0EJZ1_9PSEU
MQSDHRPEILLLNWRDTGHPEGGGSERYVERVAQGLAARGYRVTIQCSAYSGAASGEWVAGVRFRRRGRRLTVYPLALLSVLRGRPDVIVDVQNGMPFFARLVARCPVMVLVHHVHREQWRSAVGPWAGRLGWWIESWLAPKVHRKCRYIAVSEVTRGELAGLGVAEERTRVVPNGLDAVPRTRSGRSAEPSLVVVSRVVPHKRIEHAVDVLAGLGERWPGLRLDVVGTGWWLDKLREHAHARGVADRVVFHGWVDEQRKHEILARSWVHLCPSVKEGWGIAIVEAAAHGVPSVAYRAAGGVAESIVEGETGLLADDYAEFAAHAERLLAERGERLALGRAGQVRARGMHWDNTVAGFESALREVVSMPVPRRRGLR